MWTSADTHLLKLFKELKSSATVVIAAQNEVNTFLLSFPFLCISMFQARDVAGLCAFLCL
jgi:hypothetical protein